MSRAQALSIEKLLGEDPRDLGGVPIVAASVDGTDS